MPRSANSQSLCADYTVNPTIHHLYIVSSYHVGGRGRGGSQVNVLILDRAQNLAEIWTKDLRNTSQILLPLSHFDWIVCRCPFRRSVHQLRLCFCLQFTFTGSYIQVTCVMWWGHTLVRRTIGAIKCFLVTLTIYQEVWRADKTGLLWQQVSGVLKSFVPIPVYNFNMVPSLIYT